MGTRNPCGLTRPQDSILYALTKVYSQIWGTFVLEPPTVGVWGPFLRIWREYGGYIQYILCALMLKLWLRSNPVSKSFLLRHTVVTVQQQYHSFKIFVCDD